MNGKLEGPQAAALGALLGEDAQIARERAVGELRAGRPLLIQDGLIQDGSGATLIAALDGVAPSVLSAFTDMADASLILSPHRARVLGLQTDQAVASPLAGLDQGSAWRLACSARHAPPPVWRAALPAEEAAVALCKQALFLPAALAAPAAPGAALPASLFRLELSAARAADAPRLHELELVSSAEAPLAGGVAARFLVFRGGPTPRDQVAVIVGDPDPAQPVLVRVHSACLTGDLFGSMKCDCGDQLRGAMDRLAAEGGGVLLYLDQEGRGIGIGNKMRAYALQQESMDTIEADAVLGFSPDERRFEYAASILLKLGYRKIVLLTNNPEKIGALMRAGLDVVGRRPLFGAVTVHNRGYLATKAARADHDLEALLTPPAAGASS